MIECTRVINPDYDNAELHAAFLTIVRADGSGGGGQIFQCQDTDGARRHLALYRKHRDAGAYLERWVIRADLCGSFCLSKPFKRTKVEL